MKISDSYTVRRLSIPSELFIIDGFYADPDAVRDYALNIGFEKPGRGRYPGRNATQRILHPDIIAEIERIVGRNIRIRDGDAFGVFRLSLKGDVNGNFIHGDPVRWAGVLYLNPSPPVGMGTAFWTHNETGLVAHPFDDWEYLGFESEFQAYKKLVNQDGHEIEKWSLTNMVDGIYNRLILFDSRSYHSHMPRDNFGKNNNDGRLVQLFFFDLD